MCISRPPLWQDVRGEMVRWLVCFFILNLHFQVESVFETLVEDSPEEESTLTSKLSVHICAPTCVSGREYTWVYLGEAGRPRPLG